jgi:hypothetical protein
MMQEHECTELLESSWRDNAVVKDDKQYTVPGRVRYVNHGVEVLPHCWTSPRPNHLHKKLRSYSWQEAVKLEKHSRLNTQNACFWQARTTTRSGGPLRM